MAFGKWTGSDLSDTSALLATPGKAFNQRAAQLSLELSATAYDFQMDSWRQAGWQDVSYQVDNTLLTGAVANGGDGGLMRSVLSDFLQRSARARAQRTNPLSQLRGAMRNRDKVDTCKAVVMQHKSADGRYVIAIGFMGTGKRIYDWFSNFRLSPQDDMHTGFLQLAMELQQNCDAILFPQLARELGLPRLTLREVLLECRKADSRFYLWMCGHSQGGAVMQVFAYHLLKSGVLPQNMIGYGFASPSTAYSNLGCDLSLLPLHHIINSDDVTPRVGALLHMGSCHVLAADGALHSACYTLHGQNSPYQALLRLVNEIQDTKTGLIWMLALVGVLQESPEEDARAILGSMVSNLLPDKLLSALDGTMGEALKYFERKLIANYAAATQDAPLPEQQLCYFRRRIALILQQMGEKQFTQMLALTLSLPHRLRGGDEQNGMAPYAYIVNQRFEDLQTVHCATALPKLRALPAPQAPAHRATPYRRFARLSDARQRRK